MKLIDRIESNITWNKSIEDQIEVLSQFDNLSDDEIKELTNYFKSTEVGILIEYLGFEKLKDHLPNFLEFLQDMNWPAAGGASRMLVKAGKEIIPEIRRVFNEVKNDDIWHLWILTEIVQNLEKGLIAELAHDLKELINRADKDGASIQALRILKESQLLSEEEITFHYQYLLKKYEGDEAWINDLNEEIKPAANNG